MTLRVPLRQLGTGLPGIGSLSIPIEGNPEAAATEANRLTKLLLGEKVWALGDAVAEWAIDGNTDPIPPEKLGGGSVSANLFLQTDADGNPVWGAPPSGTGMGSSTFLGLTDTPTGWGTAGQHAAINAAADALEFVDPPAETFLGLTDTPADFGTAGQQPVVNAAGDGLEFVDQVREHWRGEWELNVSTAKAGDLWYTVREDFHMNVENVVWLAVEDTSAVPDITSGRAWLNLTDTDHYRGEIFENVLSNDVEIFVEHGDTFLYDDRLYFVLHEINLSINDILNETTDYTENVKLLIQPVAAVWAREGDTTLVPAAKLPPLTAETLDALIETPAAFGLSHSVSTVNDPHTLNLGLATATIARLVDTGGTDGQIYTRTATGHEWADAPASGDDAYDWATVGDTSLVPTAKLGSGTASATTFLRGDGAWAAPPTGMGSATFLGLSDTPAAFGAAGQVPMVNAAGDALEFGTVVTSPIARPEPATAAAASFDRIYGGGAGATGQDYLSYKRLVANHTVRVSVHNLNEIGFTVEKRGWASRSGLIQGNVAGGSARPSPDGIEGVIEYRGAGGDWRLWLVTDGTGEWIDDTREYDIRYSEVGAGGAAITVRLEHDLVTDVGEWREQDGTRTTPRWEIGKQYDIQIRRVGTNADVVLHAGNEIARLADETEIESVHGELLALIDDLRHQARPFDWASIGNTDLIPEAKLPEMSVDRIVFFDDMGNLRAGTDDDWSAALNLSEPFGWTGTQFQKLSATPVPKSADYTLVQDGSAISVGRRWRGAFGSTANVSSPQDGDIIWATSTSTYHLYLSGSWTSYTAPNAQIPHFVANRVFADQAAATAASEVTANGQIVLIQAGANAQAYLVSNFVAAHNTYAWGNIYSSWAEAGDTGLVPASKLGAGTPGDTVFLRGDGMWETPPSGSAAIPLAFVGFDTFTYVESSRELVITVDQAGGGTDTTKEMLPEWILIDRVATWARNNDMSRIPRSKAAAGGIFSLHTFALEHQEFQVGELAVAMDAGNAGLGQTIQLAGDPLFTLEPGAIMRIDDEEFEFTGNVGGDVRNIIGGRGRSGTAIAAHTVGTAVFAEDLNREFIQLSFTSNDQLTLHSLPLELPFATRSAVTDDLVANWALKGSTVSIPNTKFAGTPDGSKYLLDTGAWSDLPSFDANTEPWALQSNPTTRIPVGKMGSGTASTSVFLRGDGAWADPGGLSIADGDGRYLRLTGGTLSGALVVEDDDVAITARRSTSGTVFSVDGTNAGNATLMQITTRAQGGKAFGSNRSGEGTDWVQFRYDAGGSGKPGLELGPGSAGRDVELYRDASDVLKTNVRMEASGGFRATLPLGQSTVLRARNTAGSSNAADWFSLGATAGGTNKPGIGFGNAGIGSEAAPDTILYRDAPNVWKTPDAMDLGSLRIAGTAMGASSGRWNTSTLGTGTASSDNFLRGDRTWTRPTFEGLSDTPNSYGTAAQYVRVNAAADALEYADFPAILSEATIKGFIADWAETGNTDFIPTTKMGPGSGVGRVLTWSASGANWLALPSGGQYPGDDAIKDLLGTGYFVGDPSNPKIGFDYDATARTLEISTSARSEAEVNAQIEARRDIEWCGYTATITSTAVTLALNGEGNTAAPTTRFVAINYTTVLGNAHDDSLPVFVSYNSLNSGNVQVFSGTGATRRNLTVGDLKRFGWTNVSYIFRRRSGGWDLANHPVRFSTSEDVATLVEAWALKANASTRVPVAKLGSGTADSTTFLRGDGSWQTVSGGTGDDAFDWATVGNTDRIPTAKLGSGQALATTFLRGNRSWGAVLFTELSGTPSAYGSATQILQVNSAGTGLEFVDKPSGGSGTGDDAFDWATVGNTDLVPTDKLGTGTADDSVFLRGDGTWQAVATGGTGSVEELYSNLSGTALTRAASAWDWANTLDLALSRALAAGDDDKELVVEVKFTANSVTRSAAWRLSARQFRDLASNTTATGTSFSGIEYIHSHGVRARTGDPAFNTAARNAIVTRQRATAGHDILRLIMATDSTTSQAAFSDVRVRIFLVPVGGGSGASTFLGLTDTPSAFGTAGQHAVVNAAADGLEFVDAPSGGGASTFLALTDTPASFTADQWIKVNSAGDALEFVAPPSGGSGDDAFDWATVGNTSLVPTAKLGSGTADNTKALYGDGTWGARPSTWAQHGNTDRIPIDKMTGYPTSISASVSGGNFNLALNRQGESQLTWSFGYPAAWDSTGGGGLSAEQVRDTIAAFAVPGDNMTIVHRDAADELVFSAAAPVEFTAALLIDSTGHAYALTPSQPGNSYDIGQVSGWASGTPGLLQGATWLDDKFYLLTQNPRVNGMYVLDTRTLVTTQVSGTFPAALQSVGGLAEHNGKLYTVTNIGSSPGIYEIDPNDVGSTSLVGGAGLPAGMTGAINDIFSFAGKLYVVMANRDLWDIDLTDTDGSTEVGTFGGSGTQLGPFIEIDGKSFLVDGGVLKEADLGAATLTTVGSTGITNTLQAATHVRTGLTTGFVREGANLYYTDARVKDWLTGLSGYGSGKFLAGVSGSGDPEWVTADYDDLLDKPVLRVANVSSIPTPGSSNVGHRYQTNDGHQYLIESHTLGHVDRVVNYTAVATVSVGTAGYRGAVYTLYDLPPASLEATNAYFMAQYNALNGGYAWYVRNSSGDWVPQHSYPGTGTFIGGYLDEARANPNVTAAGNVIAYGDGTVREMVLYTVDSDFVAGTGGVTTYEVVPVDRDAGAAALSVFDWAKTGNTGVIPTAKLGTGTADDSVFLRGDGAWAAPPAAAASRFVGADDDGDLRDPTAADWNDSHSFSKVLGFDGHLFYIVNRELTGAHGASASYSTVAVDSTFTVSGTTYQYKGSHQHDYNVAADIDDFYFKWSTGFWRIFRARGASDVHDYWENLDLRDILPTYIRDYPSEADALAHISAVGQYVTYPIGGTYTLRRVTAYTAPSSGTVSYDWERYDPFALDAYSNEVRGIIERESHTFIEPQTIDNDDDGTLLLLDAREYTGSEGILDIRVGQSGDRKALQFFNGESSTAWGSFEFALGSINKPGFALGPGSADARDVELYRDAANVWRTPDTFHAGVFDVDSAGQDMTLANLNALGRNTDSTLTGTGGIGDPLGVEINEIIEQLQEDVRYYTDSTNYSTSKGATVGHTYDTSNFQKTITKVRADIDPPGENHEYVARIYRVSTSNNNVMSKLGTSDTVSVTGSSLQWQFHFRNGGVDISPGWRIAIVISRTNAGAGATVDMRNGDFSSSSPGTSYDDAANDFDEVNWVEYDHTDPDVGQSTESHGSGRSYGNLKIYYSITFHHASLIGDGNVDVSHIDSNGATEGQAILADSSDGAEWGDVARPGEENAFTAAQTIEVGGSIPLTLERTDTGTVLEIDGSAAGNDTLMKIVTPSSGGKAFGASRDGEGFDWVQFRYDAGGSGKPGIEVGLGSSGRDVELYRDAANTWRTPDNFHVGELRVDSGGRANSRSQLGLGTAATVDTGTGNAHLLLGSSIEDFAKDGNTARVPVAKLGSGTADATKRLDGTGAWVDAGPTFSSAVSTNINSASGTLLYSTGFTGWSGKTVIFVSMGAESSGSSARFVHGIVLFVADILAIPNTASAGDTAVLGTNRNVVRTGLQDPNDTDGINVYSFGRTSASDPELLWNTGDLNEDAYPFRAIAL